MSEPTAAGSPAPAQPTAAATAPARPTAAATAPARPTAAAASPPAPGEPLVVRGATLMLRYAEPDDAPALFELARDPAVTRFFSWGPYKSPAEPEAYISAQRDRRERGEQLDFVVVHPSAGPIGVTGLSEYARRDRRATVGSWHGHRWWGSGANFESKVLITAVAFEHLRLHRLTAWASTRNGRSQVALERLGFRREGTLAAWHRHGDTYHDVVVFGLLRTAWQRGPLQAVPVRITGAAPPAWAP